MNSTETKISLREQALRNIIHGLFPTHYLYGEELFLYREFESKGYITIEYFEQYTNLFVMRRTKFLEQHATEIERLELI